MDSTESLYLWLKHLDKKLDMILALLTGADPSRLTELKADIEEHTIALAAALAANQPKP